MARINTLDLSIGTRLGKLESGLKTAGTRIKTWSSGVSKNASGVFIGNAIGAGVGKALGGLKSALSTGFDVSIESEQALISLESLTQSSTVAKKVFGDLKSFASSTPFQINDLSNVTNKLLGFGVESENVIDTVKRLGNVSAGLNVPLESVALTFGKIKTLGVGQNGELLELAEKGIPIYSELAKQLGVSESQVKTLASQSKISFQNVDAVTDD